MAGVSYELRFALVQAFLIRGQYAQALVASLADGFVRVLDLVVGHFYPGANLLIGDLYIGVIIGNCPRSLVSMLGLKMNHVKIAIKTCTTSSPLYD